MLHHAAITYSYYLAVIVQLTNKKTSPLFTIEKTTIFCSLGIPIANRTLICTVKLKLSNKQQRNTVGTAEQSANKKIQHDTLPRQTRNRRWNRKISKPRSETASPWAMVKAPRNAKVVVTWQTSNFLVEPRGFRQIFNVGGASISSSVVSSSSYYQHCLVDEKEVFVERRASHMQPTTRTNQRTSRCVLFTLL